MAAYAVDSTKAGTSLVAAAGSITSITVTALPTGGDRTPITLTDGAGGRTLYSADLATLAFLDEPRFVGSGGVPLTPGLTAPVWPRALWGASTISFATGIFVKSCPTGIALTVNA